MILLAVLVALTPGDLTGFWHSESDLSDGYESCYFFWDTGEYACLESIEQGILYLGDWYLAMDELVLNRTDAIGLDGLPINISTGETILSIEVPRGKSGRIVLDGVCFYLLDRNPDQAIISLVPTYHMTATESEAFSTYD